MSDVNVFLLHERIRQKKINEETCYNFIYPSMKWSTSLLKLMIVFKFWKNVQSSRFLKHPRSQNCPFWVSNSQHLECGYNHAVCNP
jgi:hypothetical protein